MNRRDFNKKLMGVLAATSALGSMARARAGYAPSPGEPMLLTEEGASRGTGLLGQ